MKKIQPVIKWSGSKRPIAQEIVDFFPREINNYYEPFCGGASVMRCLLDNIERGNNKVNGEIICSDINKDLINLWNSIITSPESVYLHYKQLWEELNSTEDKSIKRTYFEKVRERLNNEHNPLDFMFILRTCYNGLIRYNQKGDFNTSYHLNRKGIIPEKLKNIIYEWSDLLNKYNVKFSYNSYKEIITEINDVMFLDPPYANVNTSMYFGNFKNNELFDFLKNQKCKWLLTYDGKSGVNDNTFDVPQDLYKEHLYLKSGNSSFRNLKSVENTITFESLYKNF